MRLHELYNGLKVRIIIWEEDHHDPPGHWADNGGMDEWQGEVVTIDYVGESESDHVNIIEDHGKWSWQSWDFEPCDSLSADDPNARYKKYKSDRSIEEVKKMLKGGYNPWSK